MSLTLRYVIYALAVKFADSIGSEKKKIDITTFESQLYGEEYANAIQEKPQAL